MRLLYGTTNPAKLSSMKQVLDKLSIDMIGLRDLNTRIPEVEETGNDPLENAVLKAHAYYDTFHLPVFSCDSGLYFGDLSPDLQPGTHIRRVWQQLQCVLLYIPTEYIWLRYFLCYYRWLLYRLGR